MSCNPRRCSSFHGIVQCHCTTPQVEAARREACHKVFERKLPGTFQFGELDHVSELPNMDERKLKHRNSRKQWEIARTWSVFCFKFLLCIFSTSINLQGTSWDALLIAGYDSIHTARKVDPDSIGRSKCITSGANNRSPCFKHVIIQA